MSFLICNDDGIHAVGIQTLAKFLSGLGDIDVLAPDRDCSGNSHSLTLSRPIGVRSINGTMFSVEGSPVDCVRIALTGFLADPPDFVISGINRGANMGSDVVYSATVAAAREGCSMGIPALAVSLDGDQHYETAASVTLSIIQFLQQQPALPKDLFFNINVPDCPLEAISGIQYTRLGKREPSQQSQRVVDPRGKEYFWIGVLGDMINMDVGTDFYAVANNYISITPILLNATDHQCLADLGEYFAEFTLTQSLQSSAEMTNVITMKKSRSG